MDMDRDLPPQRQEQVFLPQLFARGANVFSRRLSLLIVLPGSAVLLGLDESLAGQVIDGHQRGRRTAFFSIKLDGVVLGRHLEVPRPLPDGLPWRSVLHL